MGARWIGVEAEEVWLGVGRRVCGSAKRNKNELYKLTDERSDGWARRQAAGLGGDMEL